jgi:hypothetical protein
MSNDWQRDELELRRRITRAARRAIARLARVADGKEHVESDHELRACMALARIASLFIVKVEAPEPLKSLAHPSNSPEERKRLLAILVNRKSPTIEND